MANRESCLKRVQACCFALLDAQLYLDTHPDDPAALAYYQKHLALKKQTEQEYISQYGPLTAEQAGTEKNQWDWIQDPWPWECGKGA